MKLQFVWVFALLLAASAVSAITIDTFDKNLEQKLIFSPGSEAIFKVDASNDTETATLIILSGTTIVATERMKLLSEEPKQFAYLYEIPANATQGPYRAKVIAKGASAEKEFYIGYELEGQLLSKDDVEKIKESRQSIWQKIFQFFKNMFGVK
jgi:hypothetical protein